MRLQHHILAICCICAAVLATQVPKPATHHTFTCAQGGPGCTVTTVRTCTASSTTCNITTTSTHAGAVELMCVNTNNTSNTLVAATTDGTWHVATGSLASIAGAGSTECEYNLSATGGATTISPKVNTSATIDAEFFEFTYTGTSPTFDVASFSTDASCSTACSGVALTFGNGNNHVAAQSIVTGGNAASITQSYNIAANATTGNASAYKMNITTAGTTPTWGTGSSTIASAVGAMCIYEVAAGTVAHMPPAVY
jgi:hypothetical protein